MLMDGTNQSVPNTDKGEVCEIPLSQVRVDGRTQARARIDDETVVEYARCIDELPPVDVFFDDHDYWLADGFHRFFAHGRAQPPRQRIRVRVHAGGEREARCFACAANGTHGLPRTNADKRKAVEILLAEPEWATWSDRQVARHCRVAPNLVADVRRSLSLPDSEKRTYTTKHGTTAVMNTGRIGRGAAARSGPARSSVVPDDTPPVEEVSDRGASAACPVDAPEALVPPASPESPSARSEQDPQPLDAAGRPVPDHLRAVFAGRDVFGSLMREVSLLKSRFADLCAGPAGDFAALQRSRIEADVANLHAALRFCAPHAVCPLCGGRRCDACRQAGWMPEELYNATPPELRRGGAA